MKLRIGETQWQGRLNRKNELEMDLVDQALGSIYGVVDEEGKCLILGDHKSRRVPLNDAAMKEIFAYKADLRKRLVGYYNRLLSGAEVLSLIPTGDKEDYPYVLASRTLLLQGFETPKFSEVLESCFYEKTLGHLGLVMKKPFQGIHDVHARIGAAIQPGAFFTEDDGVMVTTLRELVEVVQKCEDQS